MHVIPNDKILNLLSKFKSVKIDVSIDMSKLAEVYDTSIKCYRVKFEYMGLTATIMISPTVSIMNTIKQNIIDLAFDYWLMPLSTLFLRHTQILCMLDRTS